MLNRLTRGVLPKASATLVSIREDQSMMFFFIAFSLVAEATGFGSDAIGPQRCSQLNKLSLQKSRIEHSNSDIVYTFVIEFLLLRTHL